MNAGWHHIAVVGRPSGNPVTSAEGGGGGGGSGSDSDSDNGIRRRGRTVYFVDGKRVGAHDGVSFGTVRSIGNRGDGNVSEAFAPMTDFRIFGVAATDQQISVLHSGCDAKWRYHNT